MTVSKHRRLGLLQARMLAIYLSKVCVENPLMGRSAAVPFLLLLHRYLGGTGPDMFPNELQHGPDIELAQYMDKFRKNKI